MNKYYKLLNEILNTGLEQKNKKGGIKFLPNQVLSVNGEDLNQIYTEHPVAKVKLAAELELYMKGEVNISEYKAQGITWWEYCEPEFINSYPHYFQKLPALIEQINLERRPSKNYVLFIGQTGEPTNQLPCLSLMQFQIIEGKLWITVYQRSADSNLGLPSDLYQTLLIANKIDLPLANITYFIGNAHIYENNIELTKEMLYNYSNGKEWKTRFNLNV